MSTGPDTDDRTVASGLPRAEDAAPSVLGGVIAAYLSHLTNRRVSTHTLRAYGGDLSALDAWLVEHGYSRAEDVDLRALRSWLGSLAVAGSCLLYTSPSPRD